MSLPPRGVLIPSTVNMIQVGYKSFPSGTDSRSTDSVRESRGKRRNSGARKASVDVPPEIDLRAQQWPNVGPDNTDLRPRRGERMSAVKLTRAQHSLQDVEPVGRQDKVPNTR